VILLLSLPVLSALGQRSKLAGYALILQYRVSVSVGKGIKGGASYSLGSSSIIILIIIVLVPSISIAFAVIQD